MKTYVVVFVVAASALCWLPESGLAGEDPPKSKSLLPIPLSLNEVLAWIESNRPAEPPPSRRPRGRPTKVEQLARERWAQTSAARAPEEGRGQ